MDAGKNVGASGEGCDYKQAKTPGPVRKAHHAHPGEKAGGSQSNTPSCNFSCLSCSCWKLCDSVSGCHLSSWLGVC